MEVDSHKQGPLVCLDAGRSSSLKNISCSVFEGCHIKEMLIILIFKILISFDNQKLNIFDVAL